MSASNVQPALSTTDWHLDLAYDVPSRLSLADPGIDDPVDDTGVGYSRGDLRHSDEFSCLIKVICEESAGLS